MRRTMSGFIAAIIIGLLVLSFAIFGIGDIFSNRQASTVASVGGKDVSTMEFIRRFNASTNQFSQQFGTQITRDQALAFGLDRQAVRDLLTEKSLASIAEDFTLGASDRYIAERLVEGGTLTRFDGRFDQASFQQALQMNGLTQKEYFRLERERLGGMQLIAAALNNIEPSKNFIDIETAYRLDSRSIEYITLPLEFVEEVADPDDQTLASYFATVASQYRLPEYRKIGFINIDLQTAMDKTIVSDTDAQQIYDNNKEAFETEEAREISEARFDNKIAAVLFKAAINKDPASALEEFKDKITLLAGEKTSFGDDAERFFDAQLNAPSDILEEDGAFIVQTLTKITPPTTPSFDDVKDDIIEQIKTERVRQQTMTQIFREIDDIVASGRDLEEAAQELDLDYEQTALFDQSLNIKGSEERVKIPESPNAVTMSFQLDIGDEADTIDLVDGGIAFIEVLEIEEERDRGLDEVKEEAASAWKLEQRIEDLQEKAETLLKSLSDESVTLTDIAGENGFIITTSPELTRISPAEGKVSRSAIAAAFGDAPGNYFVAPTPNGQERVIAKIGEHNKAQVALTIEQYGQDILSNMMAETIVQSYQNRKGTSINETAISYAIAPQQQGGGHYGGGM